MQKSWTLYYWLGNGESRVMARLTGTKVAIDRAIAELPEEHRDNVYALPSTVHGYEGWETGLMPTIASIHPGCCKAAPRRPQAVQRRFRVHHHFRVLSGRLRPISRLSPEKMNPGLLSRG